MPEHTPLTEIELERCLAETDEYDYECHLPIRVILEDLRESRRLLCMVRDAISDGSREFPAIIDELQAYITSCEGKGEEW